MPLFPWSLHRKKRPKMLWLLVCGRSPKADPCLANLSGTLADLAWGGRETARWAAGSELG